MTDMSDNNPFIRTHTHRSASRGVSLLVVMLVGSVLVLAATSLAGVAKRVLQSSASYQESLQSSYGAEDVFNCVDWWIQNGLHKHDSFDKGMSVICVDKTYTFKEDPVGNKEDGLYEEDIALNVSTSTFTVKTVNGGIIEVEVVRNLMDTTIFDGKVILHAYNVGDTSPRNAERLRVYTVKQSPFTGADIVFLIDRSGSIDGNRSSVTTSDEWGQLLTAVGKAVHLIADELPSPKVSYVTFGTETTDIGKQVLSGECGGTPPPTDCASYRKPDVSLTLAKKGTVIGDLISSLGTDYIPMNITTTPSETNLSLGLAIAGSELMGKFYPSKDSLAPGAFELRVATWGTVAKVMDPLSTSPTFASLPSQASLEDRPDNEFPDFIVLITDGQPNGLVRHLSSSPVTCVMPYGDGTPIQKVKGESIFFAEDPLVPVGNGCTITSPPTTDYYFCNDRGLSDVTYTPSNFGFDDNNGVNPSKCNAYITAEALKRMGITIIVIGVGDLDKIDGVFLREKIASKNDDGTARYFHVDNFEDLQDLFDEFTSKVIPTVLR